MRAEDWDERYAEKQQWSSEPNRLIADLLADLPPGDAVDLAAGEGRHALWLAGPWVARDGGRLLRGRARPGACAAGVRRRHLGRRRRPHLDGARRRAWTSSSSPTCTCRRRRRCRCSPGRSSWLRPGGRLLVLGHDVENLTAGVGGPPDPEILHSVERLAPVAALLEVDRLEQVRRETPAGTALDTLLWGRRPR